MEKINFQNNTAPYISDVNLNQMQDNIENAINQAKSEIESKFVYSTDERIVGTFYDGKPLYRKDFIINESISPTGTNEFTHGIENIDFIKIADATVYNIESKTTYSLPITLYESYTSTDNLSVRANATKIKFYMQSGWGTSWTKYISLEYTKTTD